MFATALAIYLQVQMPACKKWTWSGDVYNRKVNCLEWRKEEKQKQKEGNKK